MANFYGDNDDLRFYLESGIDWERLVRMVELDYRAPEAPTDYKEAVETYREVLNLVGQFAGDQVAPRARAMDQKGVSMDDDGNVVASDEHKEIFRQLDEIGLYGVCAPREVGGMNTPAVLYLMICEMLARADVSIMTHFGFHTATAMSMLLYSMKEGTTKFDPDGRIVETRFEKEIGEILAGKEWGAMDLTEPDAGSDLAMLRTRAVQDERGTWRLTGNKIFITSGHGKYHFVLAKTSDENSLDALSLFLVPLTFERDGEIIRNARVDRVEEKMGHHGSATCSVLFDESEGEIIGEVGHGFRLMLFLMNHARLGVGFESVGMAEAAYRGAVAYAAERKAMGQTIDQHPMIADYLDEMEVTIKGLRAMAVEAAVKDEVATRLEQVQIFRAQHDGAIDAAERKELKSLKKRVRFLTPLLKYSAAEAAVKFARMNMQIHGGNGYMKDYDAERLLRDALVLPVYEGTSQIQALMCLKDNLQWAIRNPQKFIGRITASKVAALRATDPLERDVHKITSLSLSALRHILMRIAKDKWSEALGGPIGEMVERFTKSWDPKKDFAYGMLHAERLTCILSDVAMSEALFEQAREFPERRELAERFVERALPRARYNWDQIVNTGDRLLEKLEGGESESGSVSRIA